MGKKISGGIVTYNNETTIEKCVQSILTYTKDCDFHLYVYDNCSTDSTLSILEKYEPQLTIIRGTENIGFGKGHNKIIGQIHSDYHVIINPDIYMRNNAIGKMAAFMAANPTVVQMTPEIRNMNGSIQYLPKRDPNFRYVVLSKFRPFYHYRKEYTMEDHPFLKPSPVMSCTGCFSIVKTSVLKKVHGYDERYFMYFEDADLSRKLRRFGPLVYHPGIHVYHEWKRDNTHSVRGVRIFLTSMCKYFRKWNSM